MSAQRPRAGRRNDLPEPSPRASHRRVELAPFHLDPHSSILTVLGNSRRAHQSRQVVGAKDGLNLRRTCCTWGRKYPDSRQDGYLRPTTPRAPSLGRSSVEGIAQMNLTQFEALVLAAVDRLKAGGSVEDDRFEFKREWPGPEKARQLAAAANSASGEYVIYVIGVDEKTGDVHPVGDVDVATWWPQMEARFDEVAPELLRHLAVPVSATESVTALLFRTERAPYLIKLANGGETEREVPIRVGTRTRSAHRHELLRLLYPTVNVPRLALNSAFLGVDEPDYIGGDSDEVVHFRFRAEVYFEYVQPGPVFLPLHEATATFTSGELTFDLRVHYTRPTEPRSAPFGVTLRWDGIEVTGPGAVIIEATHTVERHRRDELGSRDSWSGTLAFGVAGTPQRASISLAFGDRKVEPKRRLTADDPEENAYFWKLLSSGQDESAE